MVSQISTVCCGCSRKTGVIIIGVVQSILAFTFMILTAAYAEKPHELLDMSDQSIVPSVASGIVVMSYGLHAPLKCLLIVIAVASAIQSVFSILIIFGAETNRPKLLLPWLIFNPICIVIYVLSTIVGLVHHRGINNTTFVVTHLVVGISICLIGAYKIVSVHKYYKHLRDLNF